MLKRSARICLEVALGAVATFAIIMGLLVWRLSDGPVSLEFLTPYLETAFSNPDNGVNVRVTDTVLTWDKDEQDLDMRALGVSVRNQEGRQILSLPDVEVGFSLAAMLSGAVAPTRIEVVGARITLLRRADGSFHFGDGSAEEAPAEEQEVGELTSIIPNILAQLQSTPDPGQSLSYLREMNIVDGQLVVRDEQAGVEWWAKSTNIEIRKDDFGLSGDLSLDVAQPKEISGLRGTFSYHKASERLDLVISFDELLLSDIALLSPALSKLEGVDVALKGVLTAGFDEGGNVTGLGFEVSGGGGRIEIADLWPEPLPLRSFIARGFFDGAEERMRVDKATLSLGSDEEPGPQVDLVGSVRQQSEGLVVRARATGEAIALDDLANYWPLGLSNNARNWVTSNIRDGKADSAEINLDILLPEGGADQVKAREVFGRLTYSDLSVHYLRPLPPVTGVSGEATFNAAQFVLEPKGGMLGSTRISEGRIEIGGLDTYDQDIDIDLRVQGPLREALELLDHERLDLVRGLGIDPAKTAGRIDGSLRFRFPLESDLSIDQVEVRAEARISDTEVGGILLDKDLTEGDLKLVLDRAGMNVSGPVKLGGLGMTIDWRENFGGDAPLRTSVTALVPRVEVADWADYGLSIEPYVAGPTETRILASIDNKGITRVEGSADLTRADLGFPVLAWEKPAGMPASATATVIFEKGQLQRVEAFRIDGGGLTALGDVDFDPEDSAVSEMRVSRLEVGRTRLTGIKVREDGEMMRIDLGAGVIDLEPRLNTRATEGEETEDAKTRAQEIAEDRSTASDVPQIAISRANTQEPFDLRAERLDRVFFGPDEYLEDVSLQLARKARGWHRMQIDGKVPESLASHPKARGRSSGQTAAREAAAPGEGGEATTDASNGAVAGDAEAEDGPVTLRLRLAPIEDGTRRLSVRSQDMGAVLRALAIDPNFHGGVLEVEGATDDPDPASPIRGRIESTGFRMYDAPIMAKLLTVASLTGIVESLDGEGLIFDRLTGDFELAGDRLSTELLRAYGTSLGITSEGEVDLASGQIDMQGTVVPAYFLSRIIGAIPIIGNIILGGEGQGLIAFTYKIKGSSDSPDVTVNPLSALTPGFLRGVFDILDGDGPPPDDDLDAIPRRIEP